MRSEKLRLTSTYQGAVLADKPLTDLSAHLR